jgi:hypothetical protein
MLAPRRKVPTLMLAIVFAIPLSSVGLASLLTDHYEKICPQEIDEQDGFIYPLNQHGSVVYLNLTEYRTMQAVWTCGFGSVLGVFAFVIWLSREPRAKKAISPPDQDSKY